MFTQKIQNVFSSGELDPELRARVDKPFYGQGCRTMLNFCPTAQGGACRRPGTRYLGQAMSENGRLIPFVFSASQGRILEFGDRKMRIWMPNGSYVMKGGAVYEVATPYSLADIKDVTFAQSADVIYFAHHNYAPRKLERYADDDWRWSTPTFTPSIAAPHANGAWMQGSTESTVADRSYSYVVVAVSDNDGSESNPSNAVSCNGKLLTTTYFPRITWNAVAGAAYYKVYKYRGGVYGFIGRATGTSFDDENIGADTGDMPMNYENPFASPGDYPSQVFFFQQRLGFASTLNKPVTFWLSQSANFESFAAAINPKDSDYIEVTLASTEANIINWCRPDRSVLAFGTESSEWVLQAAQGSVLTPSNCSFQQQSSVGADKLQAIGMGGGIVYLSRASKSVRVFGYQYSYDKYVGEELTLLSRHMLRDVDITSWAYQQDPYSILWCVTSDGRMIAMTYMQDQEVMGWHRHETAGEFKNVCSIPGTPDDQVWFIIKRRNGVFIERLETFFNSGDVDDAFFLDCALTGDSATPMKSFNGLTHLANQAVQVFADGGTIDNLTVSASGTLSLQKGANHVVIGIPYTSTLIPNMHEVQDNMVDSMMHNKNLLHARVRVMNAMSFKVGIEQLFQIVDRKVADGSFKVEPFWAEAIDLDCMLGAGWRSDCPITIQVNTPTPLTVLAILVAMDVARFSGRAS